MIANVFCKPITEPKNNCFMASNMSPWALARLKKSWGIALGVDPRGKIEQAPSIAGEPVQSINAQKSGLRVLMNQYHYRALGLSIRSNRPLPLPLAEACSDAASDLILELVGDRPNELATDDQSPVHPGPDRWVRALFRTARLSDGTLNMHLDGRRIGLEEYFQFLIAPDGRKISAAWSANTPLNHVLPYLLNPGMGAALRLQGCLCLHANTVESEGQALAIIGPKGSGKSTLTSALIDNGHRLVADDLSAIALDKASAHVHSLYPRLRLTPETVEKLYGRVDALPEIWPGRPYPLNKRYRPLTTDQFRLGATPLRALLVLEPRHGKRDQARVRGLSRPQAVLNLVQNTFVQYALDRPGRQTELSQITQLVSQTPTFSVSLPDSLDALDRQAKLLPAMLQEYLQTHATL